MRRALIVLAAVGLVLYFMLPPRARASVPLGSGLTSPVRGVIHIHSRRSDGTGTVDEIAAAAARAGLKFIILTDHGDGTRPPVQGQYHQSVLVIDAVEISTDGGHVVALGLPRTPYPFAGEPRDVVADIDRLGGFAIAAHPGSPKPELRWTDWTTPIDGLEWINADSEWRDESRLSLVQALVTYPFRKAETVGGLLDRPDAVLKQWDALTRERQIVGVAGADAHARIGLRSLGEPYDNGPSFHLPSYEAMFRTFSISLPGMTFVGDAAADTRAVLDAIRAGHVYSTIDMIGGPAAMTFTAVSGSARASAGDVLPASGPVTLRVDGQLPADASISLIKDGVPVANAQGAMLEHTADMTRGAYRVEIRLPGAPGNPAVPWIVSNPIYVGYQPGKTVVEIRPPSRSTSVLYNNGPATDWKVENSPNSAGAIDVVPSAEGGTQLSFRYALSGTVSMAPYVAFVRPAESGLAGWDRLTLNARADRPTRLSVQLRAPAGESGERWHRSIQIDTEPRPVTVYFDEFLPSGSTRQRSPTLGDVRSLLFVIDTVNTDVGRSGQIWLDDLKYQGPQSRDVEKSKK